VRHVFETGTEARRRQFYVVAHFIRGGKKARTRTTAPAK
jgi:hypothetical protein